MHFNLSNLPPNEQEREQQRLEEDTTGVPVPDGIQKSQGMEIINPEELPVPKEKDKLKESRAPRRSSRPRVEFDIDKHNLVTNPNTQ